jgi:hypothetical protein
MPWTNYLSDLFALEHINTTWFGVGYAVSNAIGAGINSSQPLVGTLYRYMYQTNDIPREDPCSIFIQQAGYFPSNTFSRIIDGVIHLRMRAFDSNGQEITNVNSAITGVLQLPYDEPTTPLPNSVELEMGILEPQVLEQLRALGTNITSQSNFLASRSGAVHIFRQQIPVRAAMQLPR